MENSLKLKPIGDNKNEGTLEENLTKQLKKLQERLFELWDKFNIPNHHREIFVENFKTIKKEELIKIVENEISKLEKKCSLIQVKLLTHPNLKIQIIFEDLLKMHQCKGIVYI